MSFRIEQPAGVPGMEGSIDGTRITLLNASNELPQKDDIAIGTVTPLVDYIAIIDNINSTYTSTAIDTATTIGANLAEAININGLGVTAISDPTTGDISLTGTNGIPYDLILSGGDVATFLASPVQASAISSEIKFGRVIVRDIADDLDIGRLPTDNIQIPAGFTILSHKEQKYMGGACYRSGEEMPVKINGTTWIEFESLIDKTLPIHYRFQAVGVFTELGTLTTTPDAGTAVLPNASFFNIQGATLAEVFLK